MIDDYSGLQKAAILLITLGPEKASAIFQHLKEDEIESLTLEIANTRSVSPQDKESVLDEYYQVCLAQQYIAEGGIGYAKELLEKALGSEKAQGVISKLTASLQVRPFEFVRKTEPAQFVRILYKTLLDNEVDEKYINQILDEIEKFLRPGNSLDVILSNVYQKLILRFGQPETIKVNGKKPRVVFFVGPTGVGKTTTIAKIASKFKVNYNKNIAFITADTYRIAATDQLRTFANILDTPLSVIYTATELNSAVAEYEQADVIFVDTAGFSHKNETQRNDMRALLAGLSPEYEKSVYLVLSATTKYRDLISIIDSYKDIDDYKLIFTKLDETSSYGNLLNIKLYSDAGISYVTNGQNVPDDIEVFDTQKIVKQLLGGRQ